MGMFYHGCSHCGKIWDFDQDENGRKFIAEHIKTCPDGPIAKLTALNDKYKKALVRIADCDCDRGMWDLVTIAREALEGV